MVDLSDWRLTGQENYLLEVELQWRTYRRYPKNPAWDHDHCSFCWATFMVEEHPGVLHEGFCTLDEYHWICADCFDDFRELFRWRVVPPRSRGV
ncbi:MAG: hypothetical protein HY720_26715 [Planctomycetes bacterium]|nr:hypothetical protein [Planctomycetota bacterium]